MVTFAMAFKPPPSVTRTIRTNLFKPDSKLKGDLLMMLLDPTILNRDL